MSVSLVNKIIPNCTSVKILAGGDINKVYQVSTVKNELVLKINRADEFPNMFTKEAAGLELLAERCHVPKIIEVGQFENYQYLLMNFVPAGEKSPLFWKKFGSDLANLHLKSADNFGLDQSNFIGSLVQINTWKNSWVNFLIENRLQPMVEMAVNSGEVNFVESKVFDLFYNRINELYPIEPPALVHGDLWVGNYLVGQNNNAILIDPAVYYGNREMDIGMMHLFGGFEQSLFESYQEVYPLDKGWENRIKFNQLYPLMVHVNLFGRTYWSQVSNILEKFH